MRRKRKDVDLPTLATMTGYHISTLAAWCREGKVPGARRMNPGHGQSPWRVSQSRADRMQGRVKSGQAPLKGTRLPLGPQGVGSKQVRTKTQLDLGLKVEPNKVVNLTIQPDPQRQAGLSKRERLAGVAMQGLLAGVYDPELTLLRRVATRAVEAADILLEELEKPRGKPWRVGSHREDAGS